MSIINMIPETHVLTENLVHKWNSIKDILTTNYKHRTVEVEKVLASKYRGDFVGLLFNYNIEPEFHYPHIIANGLTSGREYNEDMREIIILDTERLLHYYDLFLQDTDI